MNTNRDRVARYIIVNEATNRIVAHTAGTHDLLERIITRLEARRGGATFFYDDECVASTYLPQIGPGLALGVLPIRAGQ